MRVLCLALVVSAMVAPLPVAAQPLELVFDDGRVTLRADGVPLRQILAEWARRGQTRIVGLEKLSGGPLSLELTDMPEKQALEILLRSVAGYVAAPRVVAGSAAVSSFDRLLLLPTSVAAPAPVAGPRPTAFAPPPQPQPMPTFPDPTQLANGEPENVEAPTPAGVPVFMPAPDPLVHPGSQPIGPGNPMRPPQMPGDPNLTPAAIEAQTPPPQGPFTTSRPGIIPVPQTPQPRP